MILARQIPWKRHCLRYAPAHCLYEKKIHFGVAICRRFLTSSSRPIESGSGQSPQLEPCPRFGDAVAEKLDNNILQTQNGELLYSKMTSKELATALLNLQMISYEPLVDFSIKMFKSPLMSNRSAYGNLIHQIVRRTAYSHFCAGHNVADASAALERMRELGFRGILGYSLEDAMDNDECDRNLQEFLGTVHAAPSLSQGSVNFACVKITAICPPYLLKRISDLLRWQIKQTDLKLPWKRECLPILGPSSPTYHTPRAPEALSNSEEEELSLAEGRLRKLCEACEGQALPLLVDAEYTSVQPAIDYLTYSACLHFNKSQRQPLVYVTIQAYLKDSLARLSQASEAASKHCIGFGVKLVRGAYITRETAIAASLKVQSPVQSSIQETHQSYNACASFMLKKVSLGEGSLVVASHNIDSAKLAAAKAEELGLTKVKPARLQFAQLKGMADSLSLGLVNAGFEVSKYIPFGPVALVMPYLIRRVEENRGLLGSTLADRLSIRAELKRRLSSVFSP